ncbi:MAG: NUDIX hydrolase [SAR202 cluster bacterium]|nr:NUDIX hydrolase [SAR202 cluster bacterium]
MPITPTIDLTWYVRAPGLKVRLAAGGVVARREGARLMVAFTKEKAFTQFVLLKGGVDPGETLEIASAREVTEETGITDLRLVTKLGVAERLNWDKDRWVTTHFYLFETKQVEAKPTDQVKHEAMWWFPLDELPDMLWPEQRRLVEDNRAAIKAALGV